MESEDKYVTFAATGDMAGPSADCKSERDGFDSRPCLHRNWLFVFDAVGGHKAARAMLKAAAFNKGYRPPVRLHLLARSVIWHLVKDRDRWRAEAIAARKALSDERRGK